MESHREGEAPAEPVQRELRSSQVELGEMRGPNLEAAAWERIARSSTEVESTKVANPSNAEYYKTR